MILVVVTRGSGFTCGLCHTLDGERLHRLHKQDAHAVEHQRTDNKNENEQSDVACESCGIYAGAGEIGKADVVEHLGRIGMTEDEQRENSGERDKQTKEIADDRSQGGDGEHEVLL